MLFGLQGQRWHFTTGLPSSAVAVEKGVSISKTSIEELRNQNSVLVMALDIQALGDTYILKYDGSSAINGSITIAGTTHDLSSIPYPITLVFSVSKSAKDDLDVSGTH
ncbi:MAG: hypothetical protein PHC56_11575 [Herbinix sp.]|nr:hypothetical protein [Herbinix sp.]